MFHGTFGITCFADVLPDDPSSATRRTGRHDCNRDAPAGFASARVVRRHCHDCLEFG